MQQPARCVEGGSLSEIKRLACIGLSFLLSDGRGERGFPAEGLSRRRQLEGPVKGYSSLHWDYLNFFSTQKWTLADMLRLKCHCPPDGSIMCGRFILYLLA